MKTLFKTLLAATLLLLAVIPASADTAQLLLVFNTNGSATGQAANVRVVITDNAGNVLIASTNTPGTSAFAESVVIPGEYSAPAVVTYLPANLPLKGEFVVTGTSPLVSAAAVYLTERSAEISAGYTAAYPATVASQVNKIGTPAGDSPAQVTAQAGITSLGTGVTSLTAGLATANTNINTANTGITTANTGVTVLTGQTSPANQQAADAAALTAYAPATAAAQTANGTTLTSILAGTAANGTAIAAVPLNVWGYSLYTGLTYGGAMADVWGTDAGPSTATRADSTHQTTVYTTPAGAGQHTTNLVTDAAGRPLSRTVTHP